MSKRQPPLLLRQRPRRGSFASLRACDFLPTHVKRHPEERPLAATKDLLFGPVWPTDLWRARKQQVLRCAQDDAFMGGCERFAFSAAVLRKTKKSQALRTGSRASTPSHSHRTSIYPSSLWCKYLNSTETGNAA
jgi:hypothetical protein